MTFDGLTYTTHLSQHAALYAFHQSLVPTLVGDGVADDTAALQAKLNSGGIIILPRPSAFYRTTAPLTIPSNTHLLAAPGTEVRNVTNGLPVLSIVNASDVTIQNLYLRGAGITMQSIYSRAIYADRATRLRIVGCKFHLHVGTAIYLESTVHATISGCAETTIESCWIQPEQAMPAIVDRGGYNTRIVGCTIRECEIGVDFEDSHNPAVINTRFEAINRGTLWTGIRARSTGSRHARRTLTVDGGYFENCNRKAIDADAGYVALVRNVSVQGGSLDSVNPIDELTLNGGGSVDGLIGGAGVKISSATLVTVAHSTGYYGRASQLDVPYISSVPRSLVNRAKDSWYDSGHGCTAYGTVAPATAHDQTGGNPGSESAKITFPVGGSGYNFARVVLSNTVCNVSAGELVRVTLMLKASSAGANLIVRLAATSMDASIQAVITDTEWTIVTLEAVADGSGIAYMLLHLGQPVTAPLDVWLGGVTIGVGELSLHQTAA